MQNKHIFCFYVFFLIFLLSYALQIFSRLNELKHIFFVKKAQNSKDAKKIKLTRKRNTNKKML